MTYFRKIFARTAISYIHFIEIGESTLNCVYMGAFKYDVSKILENFTLPLSATVSIKRPPPPPLLTSAFVRPPPHFKEPHTQFTNSNTKCLSYPA